LKPRQREWPGLGAGVEAAPGPRGVGGRGGLGGLRARRVEGGVWTGAGRVPGGWPCRGRGGARGAPGAPLPAPSWACPRAARGQTPFPESRGARRPGSQSARRHCHVSPPPPDGPGHHGRPGRPLPALRSPTRAPGEPLRLVPPPRRAPPSLRLHRGEGHRREPGRRGVEENPLRARRGAAEERSCPRQVVSRSGIRREPAAIRQNFAGAPHTEARNAS